MKKRLLVVGGCGYIGSHIVDRIFTARRFDGVLHFASFIQVGESVKEPIKYYRKQTRRRALASGTRRKPS